MAAFVHPGAEDSKRGGPKTLGQVVEAYIRDYRKCAEKEWASFREDSTLEQCISRAARALDVDGRKHPHQWRLPPALLREFGNSLAKRQSNIKGCKTFSELFGIVQIEAEKYWSNAELTVYDTAWRIGSRLGLKPEGVYLHAGAREGARIFNLRPAKSPVSLNQFPREFWRLTPDEVEDCLCIYRRDLKRIARAKV